MKQKPIIFFFIFINLITIISSIHKVSAREIASFENSTQFHSFNYDINMPLVNNSNANRICTENFEYEENTNLSLNSRYYQYGFSSIVKSFNDIDFLNTNNTYKSKYCEISSINAPSIVQATIEYHIINELALSSCRVRTIVKPINLTSILFTFATNSSYIKLSINCLTRKLELINASGTFLLENNFIAKQNEYEYVYIEYEPILILTTYTVNFRVVCYNQTGAIKLDNTKTIVLESYRNWKVQNFAFEYFLNGIGTKTAIIANDLNFISDRTQLYQKAYINLHYLAYDIQRFYLTLVPIYTTELKDKGLIINWCYATTIVQNRYLRYKTNATIYSTLTTDLIDTNFQSTMQHAFSMKYEIGMNTTTDSSKLFTNFQTQYFKLSSFYLINKYYITLQYSNYSHLVNLMSYTFTSINDNRIIFLSEFKNNFYYASIIVNNIIYTVKQYINELYSNISIEDFQILNYEFKSLNKGTINLITNNTVLTIDKDIFSFKDKISVISIYCEFTNTITIMDNSVQQIQDSQLRTYNLISSDILTMNSIFQRSSQNGLVSITHDNNEIYGIFDLTLEVYDLLDVVLLQNSGNLYLKVKFYTSSVSQLTINVTIQITRLLIYSDHIPTNNLLINKALEIMLPLLIFGMIVIAFKSNSDSKYFGFIGIYLALVVFYLMEYMSLLFLILCLVFQTLGLYFIIKHEKNEGI